MLTTFILADSETLVHYGSNLRLDGTWVALRSLATAIAVSPAWTAIADATLVVRLTPCPVLAVLGHFDKTSEAWLTAQARELNRICEHLRYVSYSQAEQDCRQLAVQLSKRFGRSELKRFRFTGIPRGGFIVLGMLAYALELERTQLEPPHPPDVPLVVTDDCALTGARFGRFLERCESHHIIFTPLCSHPDLRIAVKTREPRVVACLSVRDLDDHRPELLGDEYPAWRERWLTRLKGPRYWIGQTDHICFAWNEPDRPLWNPVTEKVESGWRVVPPELCLKNQPSPGVEPIPVQVQPEAMGPLKPSEHVIFGEFEEQIVVGNLETGKSFGLADVAADMWRAIVEYGNLDDVVAALMTDYDVDETTIRADLRAFVDDLLARGLLEQ